MKAQIKSKEVYSITLDGIYFGEWKLVSSWNGFVKLQNNDNTSRAVIVSDWRDPFNILPLLGYESAQDGEFEFVIFDCDPATTTDLKAQGLYDKYTLLGYLLKTREERIVSDNLKSNLHLTMAKTIQECHALFSNGDLCDAAVNLMKQVLEEVFKVDLSVKEDNR